MSKLKIFFFFLFSAISFVVPMVCMVKFVHDNISSWLNLHKITYCMLSGTQLPHVEHTIVTYDSLSHFTFFLMVGISNPIFLVHVPMALVKFLFILVRCRHSFLFEASVVSATFWYSASKHLLWLYSTAKVHKCFYDKHRTLNINLIHSYSFTPCKWNRCYYSIWHISIYTL